MLEDEFYIIGRKKDSEEDFKFYNEIKGGYMGLPNRSCRFNKDETDKILSELKSQGYEVYKVYGTFDNFTEKMSEGIKKMNLERQLEGEDDPDDVI